MTDRLYDRGRLLRRASAPTYRVVLLVSFPDPPPKNVDGGLGTRLSFTGSVVGLP